MCSAVEFLSWFRYTQNGLIGMLERNVKIKEAPERWQDLDRGVVFDVVLTYEERVFDSVLQGNEAQALLRIT